MSGANIDLAQDRVLEKLPKSFVQALYHAVTGKTETVTSVSRGSVEVRAIDLKRLYQMLCQRIEHYNPVTEPTVTVVVIDEESQSFSHSSWEHFDKIDTHSTKITSEVTINFEFLLHLPKTPAPQRCIVNVTVDSGLPVISTKIRPRDFDLWFSVMALDWPTVKTKIEFVDFLVAKTFQSTIEEWFKDVKKVKRVGFAEFISSKLPDIRMISSFTGRIGAGIYLAGYLKFNGGVGDPSRFAYIIALGLVLWGVFQILVNFCTRRFGRHVSDALLPSVLILSEGDKRAFDATNDRIKKSVLGGGGLIAAIVGGLALNLLASYICSFF